MEEQEYKFTAKVQDNTTGKVAEEAKCVLTKNDLVIEAEESMRIPVPRMQDPVLSVEPGYGTGAGLGMVSLTYLDDFNRKHHLSFEIASGNAGVLHDTLRPAISKARAEAWESLALECAGFWIRFLASFIDSIILNVIGWIFIAIFGMAVAAGYIGFIIGIVYIIGFWTWRGQTLGKMVVGVKIVKTDGSPIGLGRAILRYIGYWVSTTILSIGYLMITWDERKQGLHDKIAGTYVIKLR